jgi:hypothetical protein
VTLTSAEREARRRKRRREELTKWAFRVGLVLAVFGLGIALGEALHDNPRSVDTVSFERTLSVPSVPPGSTAHP